MEKKTQGRQVCVCVWLTAYMNAPNMYNTP